MTGIERIAAERKRQVEKEGFDSTHDKVHSSGQMVLAACAYAILEMHPVSAVRMWPWLAYELKAKDHIRNLERAGALIAAELDRLLEGGE